jgi:hypothetical protein
MNDMGDFLQLRRHLALSTSGVRVNFNTGPQGT